MTPRRVVISETARADLHDILSYIAQRDGVRAALTFTAAIEDHCLGFDILPERGSLRADGSRSIGFRRKAQINFRVFDDYVEILTIDYGGRQTA